MPKFSPSRVLVVLSVCGLTACAHQDAPKHAQATPVQITRLSRGTLTTYETLDGHVTPFFQSNVATEQPGTLIAIYANEGDHIRKGQILAKLDDSPLQAQLTQARGTKVQAAAHLSQSTIQEPITAQTETSALAQAKLSLAQANHQLLTDEAAIEQARLTDQADRKLLAQGYLSEQTYRQADAAFILSLQTLRIDNEKVDQAKAALTLAQRNLLNVPLQQQVIAENRGAVTSAAGGEQLLATQVNETSLIAPYDGVVTSRMLDPGAYASQSQPIFALAQINPMYVDFTIHDTDLPFAQVGTPVTFTSSSLPGRTYHTTIASIDSVPQSGTLVYHSRLIVPNPDEELRGGMLIAIKLLTAEHRNVLLAPRSAVTQAENGAQVFLVAQAGAQKIARLVTVRTGLQSTGAIEIAGAGLREGSELVAARPDSLADGSPIQTR